MGHDRHLDQQWGCPTASQKRREIFVNLARMALSPSDPSADPTGPESDEERPIFHDELPVTFEAVTVGKDQIDEYQVLLRAYLDGEPQVWNDDNPTILMPVFFAKENLTKLENIRRRVINEKPTLKDSERYHRLVEYNAWYTGARGPAPKSELEGLASILPREKTPRKNKKRDTTPEPEDETPTDE